MQDCLDPGFLLHKHCERQRAHARPTGTVRNVDDIDAATFEHLYKRIESFGIPLLAGVWPFESLIDAEFMANEVPGVRVPDQVLERMRRADGPEAAAAEGIAIARETVNAIRTMVQGVHIAAPGGRIDSALAVLYGIAASA